MMTIQCPMHTEEAWCCPRCIELAAAKSEAANTLKASYSTILLARLFGKKMVGHDSELNCKVTMYQWRGVRYVSKVEYSKPEKL